MSSTNRTQLRYIEEANWGETPTTGAMQNVRDTGDSLGFALTTTQSNEIRSDRQITDLILNGAEATGDVEMEFSAGNSDDFIASAMYNDWVSAEITAATDIAITASGLLQSTTTDFVAAGFQPGMMVSVWGFQEPANGAENGFQERVVSVSANEMQLTGTGADEAAGPEININASTIVNGITEKSFSIERELQDVGKFFLFTGMVANTWSMSATANEVLTETFSFIGKNSLFGDTTFSPETPLEPPTESVMNAVTDVAQIKIDGAIADILIESLDFEVNNNVRGLPAISFLGSADLAEGDFMVTGNMNVYFADGAMYQRFLDSQEFSLRMAFKKEGLLYYVDWPRCKISEDTVEVPGRNDDVMEAIGWQALYSAEKGYTMRIDRLYTMEFAGSNPPWK